MKKIFFTTIVSLFVASVVTNFISAQEFRKISVKEYRDKMKAGWVGQIAGVCLGGPTEFRWQNKIIPEADMPTWKPEMINNAFGQDDLYVEMTFLRSMEEYGLDVSIRQAGIDFANSEYSLWCANAAGRKNLRSGIAPPDCSHPKFNKCPNDIDYQIEADYSGLIAPGMPNVAIALGEKFGRLMNYSDGMYAGQFIGGMYAEAFFENDILKIIDAGLACIPEKCQYAEMVRDVVAWYKANPDDWEATWKLCQKKYREDPEYQKCSNGGIDVKINGAYVLIGLLYGKGDLDQTIIISTRCGQDSDCNPSSSGGVLFTTFGFSKLPAKFSEKLDETKKFSYTAYDFPSLIDVCEKLARQVIAKEGGRIEKDANGEEFFVIPIKKPKTSPLVFSWEPEPIADSLFTEEERAKIKFKDFRNIEDAVAYYFPDWKIAACGPDMNPGIQAEFRGKKNVLLTHPKEKGVACVLSRDVEIPKEKTSKLLLSVSYFPQGDWDLIVKINGNEILQKTIGLDKSQNWLDLDIDLSKYAGQKIHLELLNHPNGWSYEAGYWSKIEIESK